MEKRTYKALATCRVAVINHSITYPQKETGADYISARNSKHLVSLAPFRVYLIFC